MARASSAVQPGTAESDRALAFLDLRPIRTGHSLVIPKAHATDLSDVTAEDWRAVGQLVREVASRLRERLHTTGENLLVASGPGSEQSVSHLHVYVIPRRPDDDLRWDDWWATKVRAVPDAELARLAEAIRSGSGDRRPVP